MRKTIGFYGGTFDPIHFGHINLALQLLEIHKLDQVLFCPAYCSPLKTAIPPHANPKHRFEMARLALEGIPHFRLTSYEVDRNETSYTIDTLRMLKEKVGGEGLLGKKGAPMTHGLWGKEVKFRLLLSEEAAAQLDQWKEFQELIRLAPPLIGMRSSHSLKGSLAGALRPGFTATKIFDISSTEIRVRLKNGLYCGHLVPAKTLEYIHSNGLYI